GRVWVRVATPDTLVTYDVFLPDGRYDGTAVTSLRIPQWWSPLVRGDRVYTLVTDELDVQYVVRARIRRVGSSRWGGGSGSYDLLPAAHIFFLARTNPATAEQWPLEAPPFRSPAPSPSSLAPRPFLAH